VATSDVATALISAGAAIAAALVTAGASAYSAARKTAELRLTYAQQSQDKYLANARAYLTTIYMPLSRGLYVFQREYNTYLSAKQEPAHEATARTAFQAACGDYLQLLDGLYQGAADSFLTTELDQRLTAFTSFIRESLTADKVIKQTTVVWSFYGSRFRLVTGGRPANLLSVLGNVRLSTPLSPVGATLATRTVAAPISNEEFARHVLPEIVELKGLIKEVTLGTQAGV
jgi:hypothetical protein